MTEQTGAPWEQAEASPVRRKVAWGSGAAYDSTAAPARRIDAAPAPAPFGDAFAVPDGEDAQATDTAILHAGGFTPPAPAASDWATPPAAEQQAADLASMFDDDVWAEENPTVPAGSVESVAPAPAEAMPADEAAPAQELDWTGLLDFGPEPEGVRTAADPAPETPVTPDTSENEVPAPASATTDTEAPTPAPARSFDLASRRAALEAARDETSLAQFAANGVDESASRYTQAEYYYRVVDRILALGKSGDPQLQSMIKRLELTRDPALDAQQRLSYETLMGPLMANANIQIENPVSDTQPIFDIAYDELIGIGPLGPLWRDPSVTEIMVSGPNKVTVERGGRLEHTPVTFRSQEHLELTARTLAGKLDDRAVSSTNPLPTVQLPGARVQFAWRPVAVAKVVIAIRKFGEMMDMSQLLSFGSLSQEMAAFLCDAVAARATILVSGGTGSGKTTFVNAISEFIPDTERVVTIEDALELKLRNTHVESLVTKEAASADDTMLVGQDQLLRASLRLRPDRIIVGEIRDGKGASVMLEAANTGHDGTMTTIHANSPDLALQRLGNLLRRAEGMSDDVAKAEVGTAIDVVVQVVRKNGRRFVSHISVVDQHAALTGAGSLVSPLFVGEFVPGQPVPAFRRVAGIRPDTDLAIKMTDAGLDPAAWE